MSSLLAATIGAIAVSLAPLQRAAEVHASVGVNVHIEYTDGGYRDLSRVLSALDFLGVDLVRDAAPTPSNQGQAGYLALAKAGIKFAPFVNGGSIDPALRRLAILEQEAPGSIVSIEGPNEVNNLRGFKYNGDHDVHRAATAYQAALYTAEKANKVLSEIPIVAFVDYPYTYGRADISNIHAYPPGDAAPGVTLKAAVAEMASRLPSQPVIFTEVGFSTFQGRTGVSALAQSRLLMMSLLEDAALGARRSYIYQLLDAYSDPDGADKEKHFGVFDLQYQPKLSAQMVRRFMRIYQDDSATAFTFSPSPTDISWSGGAADVKKLIVQKSNGDVIAAVWRATKIYDPNTKRDVDLAPVAVDLRLPSKHGDVTILNIVAGTEGRVRQGTGVTRLLVGADPLLVCISTSNNSADLDDGALSRDQ